MTAQDYDGAKMTANDIIADYDAMRISEIKPLLDELYDDELDIVLDHEQKNAQRWAIINEILRLQGAPSSTGPSPRVTPDPKPAECQDKLCQQMASPPDSYWCEVHEVTQRGGTSDHGTYQLLANILIELRQLGGKLDELLTEQQIQHIRASANGGPG